MMSAATDSLTIALIGEVVDKYNDIFTNNNRLGAYYDYLNGGTYHICAEPFKYISFYGGLYMASKTKDSNSEKSNKHNIEFDTVTTYQVDSISFSVKSVFSKKSSRTLGSVLLRLMTSKN